MKDVIKRRTEIIEKENNDSPSENIILQIIKKIGNSAFGIGILGIGLFLLILQMSASAWLPLANSWFDFKKTQQSNTYALQVKTLEFIQTDVMDSIKQIKTEIAQINTRTSSLETRVFNLEQKVKSIDDENATMHKDFRSKK